MPLKFWWFAFQTATYLTNRLPSPVLSNLSPFQVLFQKVPNYSIMKVFGCAVYPYLRPYSSHKFHFHTCTFVGYSLQGYKCLDSTGKVYICQSVKFDESDFPFAHKFSNCQNSQLKTDFSSSSIPSTHQSWQIPHSTYSSLNNSAPLSFSSLSQSCTLLGLAFGGITAVTSFTSCL